MLFGRWVCCAAMLRGLGLSTKLRFPNSKFQWIGVPTRDSFSRRILKASNLGRVEARYLKPKIVFSQSTNTSPVQNGSNTIIHTQILIRVMTIFSPNASIFVFAWSTNCKSRILKSWFEYYSSQVLTPNSARYLYPSNSWIPSFFLVAKRGRVIRWNLPNSTEILSIRPKTRVSKISTLVRTLDQSSQKGMVGANGHIQYKKKSNY